MNALFETDLPPVRGDEFCENPGSKFLSVGSLIAETRDDKKYVSMQSDQGKAEGYDEESVDAKVR